MAGLSEGVTPEVMDMFAGGKRREEAKKEFTLDNLKTRVMGPGLFGAVLAGTSRGVSGVASRSFINPSPSAGLVPQGQALAEIQNKGLPAITKVNQSQTGAAQDAADSLQLRSSRSDAAARLEQEALSGLEGKDLLNVKKKDGPVAEALQQRLLSALRENPRQSQKALPPSI